MKILFTGNVPDWTDACLRGLGHDVVSVAADAYIDESKFCAGIKGIDVYVSGGLETCGKKVIESADKLKAIVFLGVDFKAYIDADAAAEKNIPVWNTPGANAQAVAELTLMLALISVRKAAKMLSCAQQKSWQAETGGELSGKTLGLLGGGAIARRVADMAAGIGMNVIYWSRQIKDDMTAQYKDFETVISASDILSLHIPKEAGTIINRQVFDKLRPQAILINTAAASLVDAEALYAALKNGKLATAAFDSFYKEGDDAWKCAEAKLFELGADRFFITPHTGWRTVEADRNMFEKAVEYIKQVHVP